MWYGIIFVYLYMHMIYVCICMGFYGVCFSQFVISERSIYCQLLFQIVVVDAHAHTCCYTYVHTYIRTIVLMYVYIFFYVYR